MPTIIIESPSFVNSEVTSIANGSEQIYIKAVFVTILATARYTDWQTKRR